MRKSGILLSFAVSLWAFVASAVQVDSSHQDPAVKLAVGDLKRILGAVDARIVLELDFALLPQQWRLKTRSDGALVISGRDGMALACGAYAFLEDYAGVRWYAYDTEQIPDLGCWKMPRLDVTRRPAILSREMYVASDYMDGLWRLRNKETMRAAYSVGVSVGSPFACHTFAYYAKAVTNDALKAVNINGQINAGDLCLTKPEVRRIVANEMIRYIRSDRARKVPAGREYLYPTVYELSQNDGGSAGCRCAGCKAFCEREGSWSGPMLDFVNAVADIVGKVYPDVTIRTFAYSYTELPPKTVRARDNVQVRFCRSFVVSPLVKGSYNGNLLEEWDRFAAHKSVWGYWRHYSGGIVPLVKSRSDMAHEMRFCRERGVTAYFAEAEHPLSRSFGLMQDWLFLKLADNPSLDIKALSDEFLSAYYGKAAPQMEAFLSSLERRQAAFFARLDHKFINRMNSGDMAQYVVLGDFPDRDFFEEADACFDSAERVLLAAGDARSLRHVREERAVVDRAVFDFWPRLEKQGYRTDLKAKARNFAAAKKEQAEAFFADGRGKAVADERMMRLQSLSHEARYLQHFPLPMPECFAAAEDVITLNWNNCGVAGRAVQDETAPGGAAMEIAGKPGADVIFGYYQSAFRKMGAEAKPGPTDGYRLYRVAKAMPMQCPHYIYLNGWHVRIWIPSVGIPVDTRDVWINARVMTDGALRFDRVFLVKNKEVE